MQRSTHYEICESLLLSFDVALPIFRELLAALWYFHFHLHWLFLLRRFIRVFLSGSCWIPRMNCHFTDVTQVFSLVYRFQVGCSNHILEFLVSCDPLLTDGPDLGVIFPPVAGILLHSSIHFLL